MSASTRRTIASNLARGIGLVEYFRRGEEHSVEQVLSDVRALGVQQLRTTISWADWCAPDGPAWYEWLVPRLAGEVSLLPCFHYTPPSPGVEPRTSSPPHDPALYSGFVKLMIERFGDRFDWIELWNEPNNGSDRETRLDPDWHAFAAMIRAAAHAARAAEKRVVLGGMCPVYSDWLERMCELRVVEAVDAVGIHGFPGRWDFSWADWASLVAQIRRVLDARSPAAEVWITEAGYSTWTHDEHGQLRAFVKALDAPVERMYWSSVHDLDRSVPHRDGFHADERPYHLGLKHANGTPKLLYRVWTGAGLAGVCAAARLSERTRPGGHPRSVLITGGAGFIGCNLADRLLSSGCPVTVFDNLSRPGVEENLQWLCRRHGSLVQVEIADLRDAYALTRAVRHARGVFHLAAQVAVTASLEHAITDFEINARGTLNLLEAIRSVDDAPPVVFTSTNKVYGNLERLHLIQHGARYQPQDESVRARGIDEREPLAFHSPYGCSKGSADQYVLDHARTFGLPAVVFRMSCIYGPHQCGTEDQGWVAHFAMKSLTGDPITLYGDGMQVRDVLFVEDLVDALLLAQENAERLAGQAFNIGGGPQQTTSLLELLDLLAEMNGHRTRVLFRGWRPGDQRYYVSDIGRFAAATGWRPRVGVREGVGALVSWLRTATHLMGAGASAGRLAS